MNWNCTLTQERLSDALEGALLPGETSAFEAHLAGCEHCARLVARVGGLVTRLRQIPPLEEPAFLATRIIAATRGSAATGQRATAWPAWLPAMWHTRLAMGAFTVAASFLIVFHAVGSAQRHSYLGPADLYHTASRHAHLTYARGVKFVNDLRVVYVIQSQFSSQPQPTSEPDPPHQQQRPDSLANPKQQSAPHTGPPLTRIVTQLAVLLAHTDDQKFVHAASRSLP